MQGNNEFDDTTPVTQSTAVATAALRTQHEIQSAIISAKKFPRNENECYARIMKSFGRSALAEDATWAFPRGKQAISGPSIHCARELGRCWGNLHAGFRNVEVDSKYVLISGFCYDLETNFKMESEDRFEKLIPRKNFSTGITEWIEPNERDLRELINRRASIVKRGCILECLPPDLIQDALDKARETMRLKNADQLKENREDTLKALINFFVPLGVNVPMLVDYLGHGLELITAEQLTELRAVARSLKDGNSKRDEIFNVGAKSAGAAELNGQRPIGVPGDIVITGEVIS